MGDRAKKLRTLSRAAKELSKAIDDSRRASDARRELGPHSSRARLTSANARWARCAEWRDKMEAEFGDALAALHAGQSAVCDVLDEARSLAEKHAARGTYPQPVELQAMWNRLVDSLSSNRGADHG